MKFKYILLSVLLVCLFSCKKGDSYDLSKTTVFATFEYDQDIDTIQLGTAYTPVVIAKEGDKVIDVTITGTVDVNNVGFYTLEYSAINAQGYAGTATKSVLVYDPNATIDISGTYSTTVVRTEGDGSNPRTFGTEVTISTTNLPGIFHVNCLLGAYYSIGLDLGPDYAMTGYIAVRADNTIVYINSFIVSWGDGLEGFGNGVYNDITERPYWEAQYASGDIFHVTFN